MFYIKDHSTIDIFVLTKWWVEPSCEKHKTCRTNYTKHKKMTDVVQPAVLLKKTGFAKD